MQLLHQPRRLQGFALRIERARLLLAEAGAKLGSPARLIRDGATRLRGPSGQLSYVFRGQLRDRERRLASLADRVCDGTASPLVHALVRSEKFSADDIAHFRKLLDDLAPRD